MPAKNLVAKYDYIMKTKSLPAISSAVLLAICAFFFVRCKQAVKPGNAEVITYLKSFDVAVMAGDTTALLKYFDTPRQNTRDISRLLKLLAGKASADGKEAFFDVAMNVDDSKIRITNNTTVNAIIPIAFNQKGTKSFQKNTLITVYLKKLSSGTFVITRIESRAFYKDFLAYENIVKPIDPIITYSTVTLEGFKKAQELKPRYDSVIWFAHVDEKTFYYVVKGKWDKVQDLETKEISYRELYKDSVAQPYGMGLVNTELKEVIPPQYDLVYTINATFQGMVEVEKNNKKGFFDLSGKNIVPVAYDQVLPIDDNSKLAILRQGDNYYYLDKGFVVSPRVDIRISDYLGKIRGLNTPVDLNKQATAVVTEYNSKENPGAIYVAPSYLVDLNIADRVADFKNPLRKGNYDDIHVSYAIGAPDIKTDNWFTAAFYSIRDHFLGGRSDFYDRKNIVLTDKKNNRLVTYDIPVDNIRDEGDGGGEALKGACNINSIKAINDSLVEVKTGAVMFLTLYDSTKTIIGGPSYNYLMVKNNKLQQLPTNRYFGFTKYIKMDDSYLLACYNMLTGLGEYDTRKKSTISQITPDMLRYMKNEIFADYRYQFKDKRWQNVFYQNDENSGGEQQKPFNANINDSLTVIDKYNINFIAQKLTGVKTLAPSTSSVAQ